MPADLRILLDEVGAAVRDQLERMHRDADRMTTSLTNDGDKDEGSSLLQGE